MSFIDLLARTFNPDIYECCHLETVSQVDDNVLVLKDGSLVTVMRLHGAMRYYSADKERQILAQISRALKNNVTNDGIRIDLILERDKAMAGLSVKSQMDLMMTSAAGLRLNMAGVVSAQDRLLSSVLSPQRHWLVVTTKFVALDARLRQSALVARADFLNKLGARVKHGMEQSPWVESREMHDLHRNTMAQVKGAIGAWILSEELPAAMVLSQVRDIVSGSGASAGWSPASPASSPAVPSRQPMEGFSAEGVAHAPISEQLALDDFERVKGIGSGNIRRVGKRYISAVARHVAGNEIRLFRDLAEIIPSRIPFRICYTILSGNDRIRSGLGTKSMLTNFVAKTSSISTEVRDACDAMSKWIKDGGVAVETALSIATWGTSRDDVKDNERQLISYLNRWCYEQTRATHHPAANYLATVPAFSEPAGTLCVRPLADAITAAPLMGTCSPWVQGPVTFATVDGKLWPFGFGDEQDYHLNLVGGPMGSGKTVLLSLLNNSVLLTPGLSSLPMIGGVDFGPGAKYSLDSIRCLLPENLRHEVSLIELKASSAYNLLEPGFGFNSLLEQEKGVATAFLVKILNGDAKKAIHPQIFAVVGKLISITLERAYAKSGTGRRTLDKQALGADKILELIKMPMVTAHMEQESTITYINSRNALYKAAESVRGKDQALYDKLMAASRRAHTLSAPLLDDIIRLCGMNEAQAVCGSYTVDGVGTPLLAYIKDTFTLHKDEFQGLFSKYPEVDGSAAKIVAVDIKPLAETASPAMRKALFILGKGIATKAFWAHKDDVTHADPVFADYALRQAEEKQTLPKYFFMDEYQQGMSPELDENIANEARIARKYREIITLATQNFDAYPEVLINLATNGFCCNFEGGSAATLKKFYGIDQDDFDELSRYVGQNGILDGKGRGLLYIGRIKATPTVIVQPVVSLLCEEMLWSYASDAQDVALRKLLLDNGIENDVACRLLARVLGGPCMKKKVQTDGRPEHAIYAEYLAKCVAELRRESDENTPAAA